MPRIFIAILIAAFSLRLTAGESPLAVEAVQDATLQSTNEEPAGTPTGSRQVLRLMADIEKHRAVIQFEFKEQSARPCAAAVLRVTTDKCWPNEKQQYIRVHRLLRPFIEKKATWKTSCDHDFWINAGGDFDPAPICARRVTKDDNGAGKVLDFDITPLVQAWQRNAWPNYGLILALDEGSDMNIHLHSKEASAAGSRPQLLLYYSSVPPKNPDMMALTTLKPLGPMPQMKIELMSQGDSKGTAGQKFAAEYFARGGIYPYTFKAAGLPEGLSFSDDGKLTGTPAKSGTYPFTVTATGADKKSGTAKYQLVIAEPAAAPKDPAPGEKPPEKKPGAQDE